MHTVMHHSLTSTYIPNVIEIEETLWMYTRTDIQTDRRLTPTLLGRLGGVDLIILRRTRFYKLQFHSALEVPDNNRAL